MATNSFKPKKFEDFEIVDENNRLVCHVRIKPSGIHFSESKKKGWLAVSLRDFTEFMNDKGKRVVK